MKFKIVAVALHVDENKGRKMKLPTTAAASKARVKTDKPTSTRHVHFRIPAIRHQLAASTKKEDTRRPPSAQLVVSIYSAPAFILSQLPPSSFFNLPSRTQAADRLRSPRREKQERESEDDCAVLLGREPALDPLQQRGHQLLPVFALAARAAVRQCALPASYGLIRAVAVGRRSVIVLSGGEARDHIQNENVDTCVSRGEVPTDTVRPAIIIANHQVDADWWYIWQAARAYKGAGNIKIVLKNQLKYVPIIGWGMRLFEFLFLQRSIEHDSVHIKAYMDSLIGDDYPFWLVIFPEGTTIHKEYVVKSQAFAEKLDRPKFERVLLPRTSGLQIILDAVGDVKPDIYDMTIAFPTYSGEVPTFEMGYGRKNDTDVPSMKSLLAGQGPNHVAIHSKKYSYEEVAQDLEKFLDARWQEKEERLNFFIKNQKFPVKDEEVSVLSLPSSIMSVFKLWFAMTLSFFMLPVVMMSFFPLYTIWVVYCFVYSIYDRTTNFWWPYIFNLFLERAAKTRDGFKSKM